MTTFSASARPAGHARLPRAVLAAPDKFRGTATAPEVAAAIARAASDGGLDCRQLPLADGGEGTVDAFGGANRWTTVPGPLGVPVRAGWRLDTDRSGSARAVIEMASASGLALAGGADGNDPVRATTRGTGELILAAADAGADEILVGLGGSATSDGGAGALEVLAPRGGPGRLPPEVRLVVLADVRTGFCDAARVFGPQKGASPAQVTELTDRLVRQAADYEHRFGIDVTGLERAGAAGGLAGGLAAIGAELVDGFGGVTSAAGLDDALDGVRLVVTGEGRFDASSLHGKVVGGVIDRASVRGVPVWVVCGAADPAVRVPEQVSVISLSERYGESAALRETTSMVARAVSEALDATGEA